jgi:3-oxoacyl-[acyl-carrier-protein] synthase-3
MDWTKRESAVLFGDGAGAVVLEAAEAEVGLLRAKLGCVPNTREAIHMPRWGHGFDRYTDDRVRLSLDFNGKEVFRNAVRSMVASCEEVLRVSKLTPEDIDVVVPHQANIRIIEALASRIGVPMDKVMVCIQEYGNTSAGSVPVALCEALEQGRVRPGSRILTTAFGAGLTWATGLIRWGERITPLRRSEAELPPCEQTAREVIAPSIQYYLGRDAAAAGGLAPGSSDFGVDEPEVGEHR